MTTRTVRTYGGWRRARGIGLFGLDTTSSLALLACAVALILLATISPRLAAVTAVPVLLLLAVGVVRVNGTPLAAAAARWLRWTHAQARGHTHYRSLTTIGRPAAADLPGVLAPTRLLTATDAQGHEWGLVWNRRTGHLTATLLCAAASTWLVDAEEADSWVAAWGSWLAALGYLPTVAAVAVTIETAPEPGTALREATTARLSPTAPADVQALLAELVARSPAAAADVVTRVSITIDPARSPQRVRHLTDAVAETGRVLTGLESALAGCGLTVLGRARPAQLAGCVRTAFDPSARGEVQRILAADDPALETMLTWQDAGPVGADEHWDHYRHDTGTSVTWAWQEAPRQQVTAGVLTRLLAPGRFPRRVTLVYRPLPAAAAARMLDNQVNAAAFRDAYRRAQHRDESARDLADRHRAQRAAAEEAQGAGVVHLSLYLTVTTLDEAHLEEAVADVEARADQSKIQLRRLHGSQAVGFAATLPAGVLPGLPGLQPGLLPGLSGNGGRR
jgi:hypothetical protein